METSNYHAFLMRLWRENGRSSWYASLENPHTGEKQTFSSLEQLWTHVQAQIEQSVTVLEQDVASTFSGETNYEPK